MVSSTTAAELVLVGTLGGAALGVIGSMGVAWLTFRHQRHLYWLDARRAGYTAVVAVLGEFLSSADRVRRGVEFLGDPEQLPRALLRDYITANDRMVQTIKANELLAGTGTVRTTIASIAASHDQVSFWIADVTNNRLMGPTAIERTTGDITEALGALRGIRDSLIANALQELGID